MFEVREEKDYILNFYREKLFDKKKGLYLITTDDGNFIFLNKSARLQLKKGKILDKNLYLNLLEKGVILNERNLDKFVKKLQKRYSFLKGGASLHIVTPTSRCNQSCKYCFAEPDEISKPKQKTDMTKDTAKKVVDFIMQSPNPACSIEFTGGEPLANFEIVKFITEYAKEKNKILNKNLIFSIVTNLTLMTEDIAQWLIENDVRICTSLDGPKEVHNKMRIIYAKKRKEIPTYDKVIYWIKKCNEIYAQKKKSWRVSALLTLTKYSLPYYKEIIDEYIKLDMRVIYLRPLMFIGKALYEDSENYYYTKEEYFDFYKKSLDYINELNLKGLNFEERNLVEYKTKIIEQIPTYNVDLESPNGAAIGSLTYFSNGNIYAAHETLGREEFYLGNVFKNKWNDIFKNKNTSYLVLSSMLENNVICDRCVYKPYCGTNTVENFYSLGKFNFYPNKTTKHHKTQFVCNEIFKEILKKINY